MKTLPSCILSTSDHKKSTRWLRVRGADSTGKKAKRSIHRHERHESRHLIRQDLETFS